MVPTLDVVVRSDSLLKACPVCWTPGVAVDPSAGYVYSANSSSVPDASLRSASNISRTSRSGKNGRAIIFLTKLYVPWSWRYAVCRPRLNEVVLTIIEVKGKS